MLKNANIDYSFLIFHCINLMMMEKIVELRAYEENQRFQLPLH